MQKKKLKRILISMLLVLIIAGLNGITLALPVDLMETADSQWLDIFRTDIEKYYENSHLLSSTLDKLADILGEQDFPSDPHMAARGYCEFAKYLDLQLKQGVAVNSMRIFIRKNWQEFIVKIKELPGKEIEAAVTPPVKPIDIGKLDKETKKQIIEDFKDLKKEDKLDKKASRTVKPEKTPKPEKTRKP